MASGGAEEDDGSIPLDIDNVHMLLQVEREQVQKRTFTNWINAQLSKRCPPSFVSDLFSDLRDGSALLDLLEVMSGQPMKRQKGHGLFQQRANIETALKFLKKKSIKLVNINIPDIIDGRPSIVLGLIWTIILHCHIEELASTLSFSSCHSSLDSLTSLDSWSSSPVPASPVPAGRTSPLHRRFRVSAKKTLLMWVRDQCQRVGCAVSVRDFESSWRSGEAFLAILCSLRPQLVDLSLVRSRSNQENLEEAFHLAERELHIPRLLEPQDVDVKDPDEKSIMTYVAQFLQYSNDMPAPDDHLELFPPVQASSLEPLNSPAHFTPAVAVSPLRQVSPSERALEVTRWLEQAFQELSESQTAAGKSSFAEKYQVLQSLADSFAEQRRPVMTLLASIGRRPELSQEQCALRAAWDRLEEELQRRKADLDSSLPPPLDSAVAWLQRAEAALAEEEAGGAQDHADAAKEARAQQDTLKTLMKDMSHHVNILDSYHNMDASGNIVVPLEKLDEIKRRLTDVRVTAKYQGIKLEYQESHHTALDLLGRLRAKVQTWKAPYASQETVRALLQDWHETVERQGLLLILMDALQDLQEKANAYISKAALGEGSQRVSRQVKDAEGEAELVAQDVAAARGTMERVVSAWETHSDCIAALQTWLAQRAESLDQTPAAGAQDVSEWASHQAKLNQVGNLLVEVTEHSTGLALAEQLSKVNMQWAECMKRTVFEVSSEPSGSPLCLQMVHSLTQEASRLLRQPLEVASLPLRANRQKLQLLSKKIADVDLSSLRSSPDFQTSHMETLQQTLPQMLAEADGACGELQRAASRLEGRLAELDRWSTEALDRHQHLKEKAQRGRSAPEPAAKALVSRGLQLEGQVVSEGQDLQDLVAQVQRTSPLQHLSTSSVQDRISEAVSQCQEILGLFSSLGEHVETSHWTVRQPDAGLLVVARAKHVDQVGNVRLQTQEPNRVSPESPSQAKGLQGRPQNQHADTTSPDDPTVVIPHVQIQMLPHSQSPLAQTVEEAESEPVIQSFSKPRAEASSLAFTDAPVGSRSPALPEHVTNPASAEEESPSPSQTHISKSRTGQRPKTHQGIKTPPHPPAMVRGEVHSKAQSMARSRLEKARLRLQGRIQQAIKLFAGKEISESQAKRKQRTLKILQPVVLEEFLGAVEGFGAFCTGPQLQDLVLLSGSVRNQWEDVRREMAAFVPALWSQIREGKRPLSVAQCETQTNTQHEAADQTDLDSPLQQQAAVDGAASPEERAESLQELCETLTPAKSSCLAPDQPRESDEARETQPSDTVLPSDCRGRQLQGNTPLRATGESADAQRSSKQSADSRRQDLSPVGSAAPLQPRGGDVLQLRAQGDTREGDDDLTRRRGAGENLKPSLRAGERPLKARLLHIPEGGQQIQTHIQAVVRGNTVERKQEAEWTVIAEAAAPSREEHSSGQEVLKRCRKSCLVFQSQLQKNRQHLEEFSPETVTTSASACTLQSQKKQLQTLKQETEALWFDFELLHAQLPQCSHLTAGEDRAEVERDWEQLTQRWRGQQMRLQSRMTSLQTAADLMESADNQTALITEKLGQIRGESVDVSSFTLADPRLVSDLREMDDRLQSEMRKLSEQGTEVERQGPDATAPPPLRLDLHNSVHQLEQLRQQLERVQSAVQALDHFLATVREVKAEIPTLLANQDPSRQQSEPDWEQEGRSWQAAMQKLQAAAEQSDGVDSTLRAVGMTLTMHGVTAKCQDVVMSLSRQAVDVEKELMRSRKSERKDELLPVGKEQIQESEEVKPIPETGDGSPREQECPRPSRMEEESGTEAKRSRPEGDNDTKTRQEEVHEAQTPRPGGDASEAADQRRRRSSQVKKDGEEKKSWVQRRAALSSTLREIKGAAEQLGLQEPTLPALQQRTRALTELESRLAGHLAELQCIRDAPPRPGVPDQTREVEHAWEEATKAVAERLERCKVLTELLKRFQSIRGELSGTLQRAESAIGEQASYMGRDNLHRLHAKVQETKAELSGLGDGVEEVRSVCRQLHTHLRQIPECTVVPFDSEADALMDRWLDISERTDSRIESLHLGLTLWDGVLQLGAEVESWAADKLAVFARSPSFQTEDDIRTLQDEIVAQEGNTERFHQRATEIRVLLQSTEPPLELQVVETQMRKRMAQLRELVSEPEDVYGQVVAAKGQIASRMAECFDALRRIQDSLLTLSGSDVATVLAKLKELLFELHTQDERAESLLEDLHLMASIGGSSNLQSLSEDGTQLRGKVRSVHRLFSEVEEQTERSIQALDRLQAESEHLKQWLQGAEVKAAEGEEVSLPQGEARQQRERTEALSQLVSTVQSSALQRSVLVQESRKLLERYNSFQTKAPRSSAEKQSSPGADVDAFQPRSGAGDLEVAVDSAPGDDRDVRSPEEQRRDGSQVVVGAAAEEVGACLQELGVTGNSPSPRQRGDVQETSLQTEEQWREPAEPDHSAVQADPELTSSYLTLRQEACCRARELQRRAAQRRQTCLPARQLQAEAEPLQSTLTSDATWEDSSSSDELETCWSSLMSELEGLCPRLEEGARNEEHFGRLLRDCRHKLTSLQERMASCQAREESAAGRITDVPALEALLQEVTDAEKDLLQIVTLEDSIAATLTSQARAGLSQQVDILRNHQRALDGSIRESLALVTESVGRGARQVGEQVSCVQKDLGEDAEQLCGKSGELPDVSQLKQRWHAAQECGTRLREPAASVDNLQRAGESGITREAVAKDVDRCFTQKLSLGAILLQKKQECAENAADRAALDERLGEGLSEPDSLSRCLGTKTAKELEKSAADALDKSAPALEALSKCLVSLPSVRDASCLASRAVGGSASAADNKENSERDDAETGVSVETADEDARVPPQGPYPETSGEQQLSERGALSANDTEPLMSDPLPVRSQTSVARREDSEPSQEDSTSSAVGDAKETTSAHRVEPLVGSSATKPDDLLLLTPENVSEPSAAQSEASEAVRDAEEQERHSGDVGVAPKKVFTVVLDAAPMDAQRNDDPDAFRCALFPALISTESDETDLNIHRLKSSSNESQVPENPLVSEREEAKPTSAKLSCKESSQARDLMHDGMQDSSKSRGAVAECRLTGARAAGATFPGVRQEEMTDFRHPEERTASSASLGGEGKAVTAHGTGTGHLGAAGGGNPDPERTEAKLFKAPERRVTATLPWKAPASLEDAEVTQGEIPGSMEPDRTAAGLAAAPRAQDTTGGSPELCKHKSSMQDILSEIQSLVERSNIINRTPHIDLNWYLKSSPGEAEIQLMRTVQKVLACRYQPAQLDVTLMAKQLQEAEDYRKCVQEQVASMKSTSAASICDPEALKSVEGQCSAALLDASATVQVKAAQLDQVKQYHKQMKIIRAFLGVLAAEMEKMTLDALGSSAIQADKLHALRKTMVQKKDMMEELLHLSSQLSVHLSDAESSGALLAQLGDVQEEWRLLEGSIKRALQHASSSTSQSSLLIKEAEQLKAKLEALQRSIFQSHDSKSALEVFCLTTDLKLYNQLYLHLQSQSDALVHFSLGQKEKDEIKRSLQELASMFNVTKGKLDTSSNSCGGHSSAKINKKLQDLITWAKQAENHISIGKKLALFPEEARVQIIEMKKFQTDIWSRRSKMQAEVEQMKDVASAMEKEESDQVVRIVEDLYEAIADSLDHVLDTMRKDLQEREKLLCQLASMDVWLAETHANRDPCTHVDSVSKADIKKLENELNSHKLATVEIERQMKLVDAMMESYREIAVGLSPGESRYLVNRLSGLWTELDGLLAHEKATSWELEELIHERTSSDEELSTIQAALQKLSTDLEQQRFPLTRETLATIAHLKHMLMEHQWEVQELQHCQEAKRNSLLCTIGELQDRCKALSVNAFEQDKYLHLRRQMEESRDIAKEQIQRAKDKTISVGERFTLCQTLLVVLPLVKTQCQEAADQLEAIAQEMYPSELNSERQRIFRTVETLVSWERSVTDDIKSLEAKLLLGLGSSSELPALMEWLQRTREELECAKPVNPDEKEVDVALRRYWVLWRNMESGMRVLEGLGQKDKMNLKNYKELYSLRDSAKQECHSRMESLSQARESLKDYQWAAQGAIGFLHNAEATFLSAPGGFLDCTEEQRQTQQALEALEDGFQAHISHLAELFPQQPCLSRAKTEQLHISILSQLLVGRAVLEAQAQLRLESLQSCEMRQQSHRKCHEDIRQRLSGLESTLAECTARQVTSYEKCVTQQRRAELLMEELRSLAAKMEELRAGCPMQGCGVGKDGELGALWRRWVSLRRGVGLLMAHTEQRGEEWKDITTSMEQCCSFLASLQADVPDCSTVSFTQEEPQELLAQAEMHQAELEQEQQALASLEHRLEHALSLSSSQEPTSPGPVGKTLVKIQENVRSLKERNLLVVAAAQAEEKERQQVQEEIAEVEQHMFAILPLLETCSDPCKQQELRKELSSQRARLKCIEDGVQSRYAEIPADISRRLQEVQLSVQREEEKHMEKRNPVRKLNSQVVELAASLEEVKALLEQRSPTFSEAQSVLKHVWDELDTWHSRLMLLENEVQDLAEEHTDQAHLLMDQLTQPLQLYQNAAQMAEQRTAFLSKIPACLQEFEDIAYSATCWLDEAHSWLSAPCSFTTARSLQNHANSLQLVLDDSERIIHALRDFGPVLDEISAVCDMSAQEERLNQSDQQVHQMQRTVLELLEQLLQSVAVVEAIEAELKTMEKNIPKIRAILSSMDDSNISPTEHLNNRQVILANVQSMRRMLEEMERCRAELHLPQGAEENLLVFSRARLLLQPLQELEQLTQQQAALLEHRIGEEDRGAGVVSETPEEVQQLHRALQRRLVQEAFEVSNSEEEEDEENESCHSSSSDTLTCSIPEDPDDTLSSSDVQSEDQADVKLLSGVQALPRSLAEPLSREVETSSEVAETGLLSAEPLKESGSVEPALTAMDAEAADAGEGVSPQTATAEEPVVPDAPAAAAVEDTRLIPARPMTPFAATRASHDFAEEGNLSLSTAPLPRLEESDVCNRVGASQGAQEASEVPISLAGREDVDEERLRWSQLYAQVSQKLTTLRKVREEHHTAISSEDGGTDEKVPEAGPTSTGSASAVLQRTRESIAALRQIVSPADGSPPGVNEELYGAARRLLLSLDALTDLLLTPGGSAEDKSKLRLLQQECVSAELVTLAALVSKAESGCRAAPSGEGPDALRCLASLQDCLRTAQLVVASSTNQLTERLGITDRHQELSSDQLWVVDEFDLGGSELFPSIKDAPSLEKLLQVLRSQLAFVQHLFQREPEALRCQEDERVQLEARAEALQERAVEQEVASQRRIRDRTRWEDNCGRLGRLLDDHEAFIGSGEPEGEDERLAQHRLDACQRALVQLDESRAALGLILDQGKLLQMEPGSAATVSHAGGALELRWQSAHRRTEQEIQRCRDIQESRGRFHTDFASVSEWLTGADKHLETWSNLADASSLDQERIRDHLIGLLDFTMETEAMSAKRASVSREASRLFRLREADCPELRAQLAQVEGGWTRLTSDLSQIQERLQQRLLAAWPPVTLLSELEVWLEKLQPRVSQEKEAVLKAKDAAQLTEVMQRCQELRAGLVNGQLLLDFLCQSGPQVAEVDAPSLRGEPTVFAEKLGDVRLRWLQLQRGLESQLREVEHMRHTCADRERRLHRLRGWVEEQNRRLNHRKQLTGQTPAREALLELEAVVGKVKDVGAALQELKATRVHVEREEDHPCDVAFSAETESVCRACEDLSQQVAALRPVLHQAVGEWGRFESALVAVSLHTASARCALQRRPLLSQKQAEARADRLQILQERVGKGEALWAAVDKSYEGLEKTLHRGTAQELRDQMEGERERWKEVVQELKEERVKAGETLSLWQDYTHLSDRCSGRLQNLWHRWEELRRAAPQPDAQAEVRAVELQEAAGDLQNGAADVLAASKPLIGQLEPPAADLIQSETRLLSRDVLRLSQATSATKKSLQEDLERRKRFHSRLDALEQQMQNVQSTLEASRSDTDSGEVVLELSGLSASLVDVGQMSVCETLNSHESERLRVLRRRWAEGVAHVSDTNSAHRRSQSLQEMCEDLLSIQKTVEDELKAKTPQSCSSLHEMLSDQQRLEADIIAGRQLLQALLRHAVESAEKETAEKRSALVAQAAGARASWFDTAARVSRRRSWIKEHLTQWRVYRHGLKLLWKLLREVEPLLPPAGPAQCTVHQLRSCINDGQCVQDALGLHSAVLTQTLEAGARLREAVTESECRGRVQSELQAVQEAWTRTTSLLERRRKLVDATVQKWSACQDGIAGVASELDEARARLKRPRDSEDDEHIQETELCLQRLSSGLRELATMKTDLSQYVAAGDSALLEQQLEQLHAQWEELCMKVSMRRQEIADRLNAWTIFNDKNKEFCDWLTQMENKVCHSGDLSIEEMVEKLKKDCMEEINLFSENKSHLKQLGEQLLLASDEAKQTQVHGSLLEVNQRWHNLFHHIEARVKKLKETLVTVQRLDKNMSNLRSWLSRMEAELSRPITYSVCHHQEIQRRLAEQQELQRDIEQHTEGVASVLSLCDVLLRDEDAAGGGTEVESDSLQETSRSLDQRWRTICAMALDRRLRIEETWRLWCKFLDDYSRFEDWLKMAERTAANPNCEDVPYTVAKEELKKFEGFQRQVHERLTQLELVNNQYRRLARENRTDRASQLRAMVHEGNRRWDALHRRVAAILRRLKYFTGQREEFEGTRESMLVWLTELDLQLTNVEHFSESDVHHKIQQLNSFQKEITLNTERIDGLIVFGEGLIQKSSPQDAVLIEDELEELHSYCQEVFSRLVRFHQRLSQPPMITEEPELSVNTFSLESSLELIGRLRLGRSQGSLPATPTHLPASPLERSGRETPVSVDSLPLEWDHTGDVGGSSSHEDDEEEEEEEDEEERAYFSALSEVELTESQEDFVEAPEAPRASSLAPSRSAMATHESPRWRTQADAETQSLQLDSEGHAEAPPALTSTPLKSGYLRLMSQCSGSIEDIKRVSLILDDEEQPEELGLTGLRASDKQSGVIERWELLQAQSRSDLRTDPQEPQQLTSDLDDIASWLENVIPELERLRQSDPAASVEDMAAGAKELKETHKVFARYKSVMLSVNLRAQDAPELQERAAAMNRDWSRACTGLQQWDTGLRRTLMRCQEFHETLHSLLLWLAHAESRRYAVDIHHPDTPVRALQQHRSTLTDLREELQGRETQQASLQALWSQLRPEEEAEDSAEAQEKLHVTAGKLRLLLRQVDEDLSTLQQRLDCESASEVQDQSASADAPQEATNSQKGSSAQREKRDSSPPRSLFYRVLRAAFPLHLLLLFLLLLPCLILLSEGDTGCTGSNNFARSFYPMLRYTNGPPPT